VTPKRRPFDIRAYVAHGSATIVAKSPLTVVTGPELWAYALSFPASWEASAEKDGVITVRLRVLAGTASVLCDASDPRRVIDERLVATGRQDVAVDLVVSPLGACRNVVIRNGGDGPAAVAVRSLEAEAMSPTIVASAAEPLHLRLAPVPGWSRYYGTRGDTPAERLRSARYAVLDAAVPMAWLDGLTVFIEPEDDLSRALYISGTYEPETLIVMRQLLRPGGVCVDLGANAGLLSMVASRAVGPEGRVYSFEPSAREFARLKRHVEANRLHNVRAIRCAVSDRMGVLPLRVAQRPHAGQNTIGASFGYDGVLLDRVETVEATTLDAFVERERLESVDLIKMDVEGSELRVLAGAENLLRNFRPAMIVEVVEPALSASGAASTAVIDAIRTAGYAVLSIDARTGGLVSQEVGDGPAEGNIVAVPAERVASLLQKNRGEGSI
jgi:FkbM family methyltransferase